MRVSPELPITRDDRVRPHGYHPKPHQGATSTAAPLERMPILVDLEGLMSGDETGPAGKRMTAAARARPWGRQHEEAVE